MTHYKNTRGVFHTLPRKVLLSVMTMEATIKLNGRTWLRAYVSKSRADMDYVGQESEVHSIYYVSEDGLWLIRAANHWCQCRTGARQHSSQLVNKIGSCHWSLDRSGQEIWIHGSGTWQAGIIKLSDLK